MKQGTLKKLTIQLSPDIVSLGVKMAAWDITGKNVIADGYNGKDNKIKDWALVTKTATDIYIPTTAGDARHIILRVEGKGIHSFQQSIWHPVSMKHIQFNAPVVPACPNTLDQNPCGEIPLEDADSFTIGDGSKEIKDHMKAFLAHKGEPGIPGLSKSKILDTLEQMNMAAPSGDRFLIQQSIVKYEMTSILGNEIHDLMKAFLEKKKQPGIIIGNMEIGKIKKLLDTPIEDLPNPSPSSGLAPGFTYVEPVGLDQVSLGPSGVVAQIGDIAIGPEGDVELINSLQELKKKFSASAGNAAGKSTVADAMMLEIHAYMLSAGWDIKGSKGDAKLLDGLQELKKKMKANLQQTVGMMATKGAVEAKVLESIKDVMPIGVIPKVTVSDDQEPGVVNLNIEYTPVFPVAPLPQPWTAQCSCGAKMTLEKAWSPPAHTPCPCCNSVLHFIGGTYG